MAEQTRPQPPTSPRSSSVTLRDAAGARLAVYAYTQKTGARVEVVHTSPPDADGKRTRARGATSRHATLAEAVARQQALVQQAIKAGWTRPVAGGPKPDAFDGNHLPAPKPAAGKK